MNTGRPYTLAVLLFTTVCVVLAFPYVQARLRPIQPLVDSATSSVDDAQQPIETDTPNTLKIPSLGIVAPIMYVDDKTETAYQAALHEGVVHYPGTALPGEFGNVYIFGHSSDFVWSTGKYKTVFAHLPDIKLGDEIDVTNADGQLFRYLATDTKIVWPSDLSVLDQHNNEQHLLSVQTSYPVGTALQRFVVIAELKSDLGHGE